MDYRLMSDVEIKQVVEKFNTIIWNERMIAGYKFPLGRTDKLSISVVTEVIIKVLNKPKPNYEEVMFWEGEISKNWDIWNRKEKYELVINKKPDWRRFSTKSEASKYMDSLKKTLNLHNQFESRHGWSMICAYGVTYEIAKRG
jgi:hypothetical protein